MRRSRAEEFLGDASPEVAAVWAAVSGATAAGPGPMGLAAGDRPGADVEVLAGAVAALEFELARRLHAAASAGALPLAGREATLLARGWARARVTRIAHAGPLVQQHPGLAGAWAAGLLTPDHVDPIAVAASQGDLPGEGVVAVLAQLEPMWGTVTPAQVKAMVAATIALINPAPDPEPDEQTAHASRGLDFSAYGSSMLISGQMPILDGEAVRAAIDAIADTLRSTATHTSASARRADALVQLVSTAHASGSLPSRGGLPVSVTVTLATTTAGDVIATTSGGRVLTPAETRFACCDPRITPILVEQASPPNGTRCPGHAGAGPESGSGACCLEGTVTGSLEGAGTGAGSGAGAGAGLGAGCGPGCGCPPGSPCTALGARVAALAATLLGTHLPLAVGRTARTATPAQRRALATRDRGCAIPGCAVPAEACQVHHVTPWNANGPTDLANLVLVCWPHHREVELNHWQLDPDPETTTGAPWTLTHTPRTRWTTRTPLRQ